MSKAAVNLQHFNAAKTANDIAWERNKITPEFIRYMQCYLINKTAKGAAFIEPNVFSATTLLFNS
jgi:hypothetical protein